MFHKWNVAHTLKTAYLKLNFKSSINNCREMQQKINFQQLNSFALRNQNFQKQSKI